MCVSWLALRRHTPGGERKDICRRGGGGAGGRNLTGGYSTRTPRLPQPSPVEDARARTHTKYRAKTRDACTILLLVRRVPHTSTLSLRVICTINNLRRCHAMTSHACTRTDLMQPPVDSRHILVAVDALHAQACLRVGAERLHGRRHRLRQAELRPRPTFHAYALSAARESTPRAVASPSRAPQIGKRAMGKQENGGGGVRPASPVGIAACVASSTNSVGSSLFRNI